MCRRSWRGGCGCCPPATAAKATRPTPLGRDRRLVGPTLRTVEVDEAIAALRALTEHRDDLVRTRTQLINRLHALLVKLVPSGLPRGLTAESAADALRRIRPRDTLGRTLRRLAVELVAELRRLDRRLTETTQALADAVTASGTTLTRMLGVGDVVAAKLLARTGPISRFASAAAFAGVLREQ
jgi:transposase